MKRYALFLVTTDGSLCSVNDPIVYFDSEEQGHDHLIANMDIEYMRGCHYVILPVIYVPEE